jgi:hypothetical protein
MGYMSGHEQFVRKVSRSHTQFYRSYGGRRPAAIAIATPLAMQQLGQMLSTCLLAVSNGRLLDLRALQRLVRLEFQHLAPGEHHRTIVGGEERGLKVAVTPAKGLLVPCKLMRRALRLGARACPP